MKWFKHYSDMSLNDKIGKLEARFGLVGYAVYIKTLELCATNWDEISDPIFHFNLKRLLKTIGIQPKKGEEILNFCSQLELFLVEKCENNYEIYLPKLAKIKKRNQKKDVSATNEKPSNDTPNKRKNKEKDKDTEEEDFGVVVAATEIIKTNDQVYATYQFTHGYPRELFDEFARDAWPIYSASNDPAKDWKRFLSHFIKNSKPQIEERMREMISNKPDKSYSEILSELFSDEVASV